MENILPVQKKSVLLVEDEDSLRMAMSIVFRASGYRVLQAANGNDAYEIVKKEQLDVIVSDVRMPNGDGINLLQKVRDLHYERPVLLLVTGYTDLKNEDAYDMGADAVFPKPFDRALLLSTIQEKLLNPQERWSPAPEPDIANLLKVHLQIPSLHHDLNGKVLRLGRGGFFVALDQNFPSQDSEISFSIESTTTPVAQLDGVGIVRWVRPRSTPQLPAGCGIEFKNINTNSLDHIIQFILQQKVKSLIPKS